MRSNSFQLIAFTLLLATAAMDAQSATRAGTADALLKPPLVEDPRQVVIQKVTGFQTLAIEAYSTSVLMNKIARCRTFENVSRSDVVRRLAPRGATVFRSHARF